MGSEVGIPDVLCALIETAGDPRALEPLRELRAGLPPGAELARRLDVVLPRLEPWVALSLSAAVAALCETLEEDLSSREAAEVRSASTREALLARVYADPDDVEARLVLADHLLEQSDPLGEFISLQCAQERDEARVARLLETHRFQWEAPLGAPPVADEAIRFERGFPVSVRMSLWFKEPLPEVGPAWSPVRELDWGGALFPDLAAWLERPALRNVRVMRHMAPEMARKLRAGGPALRQVDVLGPVSRFPDFFTRMSELSHLEQLNVIPADPEDVGLCASMPLASRLKRFEARGESGWALVAEPAAKVPVQATLGDAEAALELARAIRGAAGFGTRALSIRMREDTPVAREQLQAAAFAYARIEWR
nr:TIGR02996 domain-containing protein [Pyxidicoccus fallax]